MKTSELTGSALDWAVAKALGWVPHEVYVHLGYTWWKDQPYRPSDDWAHAGPIIEREGICIRGIEGGFHAWYPQTPPKMFGRRLLEAAMRCYVASKLGNEVEIPKELTDV